MTANQIRQTFLDFFASKGHSIVPSAPMVVKGDPTLMFTNAGMNQFKDVILGNVPVASARVADTQKCLRVSGKHNDLEEVGHDTYHHTMFEMLGNWSFGNYFKKEAIDWAWELLTEVYKLPVEQIYVTVYQGDEVVPYDEEAKSLWLRFLPADHIIDGNRKDNFWEMGETGPCGPCSEIHFDNRPPSEREAVSGATLVNKDNPLVIEIWNLVFMQYLRKADGSLEPLAMKCIDTGMGFERLCMIIQGVQSNYDTDVFRPTISRLSELCGKKYGTSKEIDVAMRVVADHLRAVAFSIADGQLPSNQKAGYVIRRILRRAVRYGYTYLGFTEPFIWKLVDVLAQQMGGQFGELRAQKELIEKVIQEEEASFLRTLANGINLLEGVMASAKGTIDGRTAFELYDTFGFPIDLTELIAKENGLTVDLAGFEKHLAAQKERSRGDAAMEAGDWVELIPITQSEFVGYDTLTAKVRIARYRSVTSKGKTTYQLVLDRTPFYGNSGGQVGDVGMLGSIPVTDTLKENGQTVHVVESLPEDLSGEFTATVDAAKRAAGAANHSATHLMHEALRAVLGDHVEQKGSLVTPEVLRFDFSHFGKVAPEELRLVERKVNAAIRANLPLDEERNCSIEKAKEQGATMLFGEKYGDKVRVVRFGDSIELCGGTHVAATGSIGFFRILSEGAISAGVRRIEAITGARAEEYDYMLEDSLNSVKELLKSPKVVEAMEKLLAENETLAREVEAMQRERVEGIVEIWSNEIGSLPAQNGVVVLARKLAMPGDVAKNLVFALKSRFPNAAIILGLEGEKPSLAVGLGDEVVARGVKAGDVVREAAKKIDGSGGGQPAFAIAGGKNPAGMDEAMSVAAQLIVEN